MYVPGGTDGSDPEICRSGCKETSVELNRLERIQEWAKNKKPSKESCSDCSAQDLVELYAVQTTVKEGFVVWTGYCMAERV